MDVLGIIFLVILVLIVLGIVLAVLMSKRDISRYMRIRRM